MQREQWHSGWLAKLQEISSKPSIQQHIQNAETEPLEIQRTIEEALAASATFCLWDKQMRLLSRTQNDSATKNVPGWTPFRCVDLVHAAAGELTVRIPVPGQNTLPPPLTSHDVTAFCPIKNPGGEVVATLVIQSSVIGKSFAEVVETWNTNTDDSEAFDTYVVDGKGHLLSQNRFPEQLRQVNELVRDLSASELRSNESKGSQNIQGTLIRDPGMDLLGGGHPIYIQPIGR